MASGPWLDQSSQTLNLRWTQGDPVSMWAVIHGGAGWAGTYTVESDTAGIAAMTATVEAGTWSDPTFAAGPGPDGRLTVTLSAVQSAAIAAGVYGWRLQQVGGVTRLSGAVDVTAR